MSITIILYFIIALTFLGMITTFYEFISEYKNRTLSQKITYIIALLYFIFTLFFLFITL